MARFHVDPGRLVMPVPRDDRATRLAQLMGGLLLYGVSSSMLVLAGLGLDPWDVFHPGLARQTGLRIGTWAIIVGALVLLAWIPLRQKPGIGSHLPALHWLPVAQSDVCRHCWHLRSTQNSFSWQSLSSSQVG